MKRLEEMTLQELWELFPIALAPHNPLWKQWAADEISLLASVLSQFTPLINHIGSTAIPTIQAKPIIDILVEVPAEAHLPSLRTSMETCGYICMAQSPSRMSFNKGYTPQGYAQKVFHIHVHRLGDNSEILFRDYLIAHPDAALQYQSLKQSLLPAYRHDRDAYTAAKTPFITATLAQATQSKP